VIPFQVTLQPGAPAYEQVAFAARKAIVAGRIRPGEPFPSVRALSKAMKIHANMLEVRPGIGTVVAQPPSTPRNERTRLLRADIEQLAVEAIKLGVSLDELQQSIADQWRRLRQEEGTK
jgi:GntR family transcriptional regulator